VSEPLDIAAVAAVSRRRCRRRRRRRGNGSLTDLYRLSTGSRDASGDPLVFARNHESERGFVRLLIEARGAEGGSLW
jgi:hypothetical protein